MLAHSWMIDISLCLARETLLESLLVAIKQQSLQRDGGKFAYTQYVP